MGKAVEIKCGLPEIESTIEKWLRENAPRMKYALVSKIQLLELDQILKTTDSKEEKGRLCREFIDALFKGN